jgi:hypothetical protein
MVYRSISGGNSNCRQPGEINVVNQADLTNMLKKVPKQSGELALSA